MIPVTIIEASPAREENLLLEVVTPAGLTLRFSPTLAPSQLAAYVGAITAQEGLSC